MTDFSESALKLDPSHGLTVVDWFTPGNWQYLDDNDLDLSSSGPLLIPGTGLLAGGGKTGDLYVLDTASLGHWNANDSQVVQKENITAGWEIHGGPVYWAGTAATGGPLIYNWGAGDVLKAYAFNGSTFATSPSAEGTTTAVLPGGFLALSANGNERGSGVLWASTPGNSAVTPPVPTALHAFNAENITTELWNSTMNAARDGYGGFAHSVPPLVANGKVYLATASNQVAVYGLLSTYTLLPTSLAFGSETTNVASQPRSVTVTNTGAVALTIASINLSSIGPQAFSQTNTCGTSVAVAGTCTISVVFKPTSMGSDTATLSVNAGNGAGTQTVALSGTGIVPTYPASPPAVAFGNQLTNVASATKSIATTCLASGGQSGDGWAGTKSVQGTANVNANAAGTITYTITCSSGSNSVQAVAQVIASVIAPSPPSSGSGGGALDVITLLGLLTIIELRRRWRVDRSLGRPAKIPGAG